MNIVFFENVIHFVLILHAINLINWRCWNHDHSTIFSCCFFIDFGFFDHISHIDFLNFLTVSRLTTCVHDFEFLIVVMKTTETICDLIDLKFEKIVDLNISWLDDFIWNDLMKLIVNDFLKFCAVFVDSDLVIDLN